MEDDQFPDAHKKILASIQYPIVGEAGKTGAWRTIRPIIQLDKCIVSQKNQHNCHFCWLYCPEGTISRTIPPKVDYDYCKGCGICAHECPHHAIKMVEEGDVKSCPM